jgi:hypothetical protein
MPPPITGQNTMELVQGYADQRLNGAATERARAVRFAARVARRVLSAEHLSVLEELVRSSGPGREEPT